MSADDDVKFRACMAQAWDEACHDDLDGEEVIVEDSILPHNDRWEIISSETAVDVHAKLTDAVNTLQPVLWKAVDQICHETGLKRVSINIGFRVEPLLLVTIEDQV